jgi:hypothetical protein
LGGDDARIIELGAVRCFHAAQRLPLDPGGQASRIGTWPISGNGSEFY